MFSAYLQKEYFLAITDDLMPLLEKAILNINGGKILERKKLKNNVLVLRLHFELGSYGLFQLGAFVQIEKQAKEDFQDSIDALFPDQLQ